MALERKGEKKRRFRRKKKHFKKKHHRMMMKPQVYVDQQSSVVDVAEYQNAADEVSLQDGDIVIEKWEDQFGNVVAASAYSYKSESSSSEEVEPTWTELALPSTSVEVVMETPFPKVLLNGQEDVEAVSSSASTIRNTLSWAVASIVSVCYVIFS